MKKVLNKRSNDTSGGYAKSPTTNNLEYGEIAVNYHDGVEKLFIKNDYNQIVSFPTDEQVYNNITDATNDMATKTWVGQQGYLTQHQDISGKADKVSGATAGNIAKLDASGNLTDGGDTVKKAESMASDVKTNQEIVYRKSQSNIDSSLLRIDKLKGKTLVWNQIFNSAIVGTELFGLSFSDNGNTITINGTVTATTTGGLAEVKKLIAGHKYYIGGNKSLNINGIDLYLYASILGTIYATNNYVIFDNTITDNSLAIYYHLENGTSANGLKISFLIIDLTLMFGTGNEPSTVDEFEAMFPLPCYDYHPGKLINNGNKTEWVLNWNQLVDLPSFDTRTVSGVTLTNKQTYIEIVVQDVVSDSFYVNQNNGNKIYIPANNKYIVKNGLEGLKNAPQLTVVNGSLSAQNKIFVKDEDIDSYYTIRIDAGLLPGTYRLYPLVCNLTLMFGAGNEPKTVEEFEELFPEPYYPYNSGETKTFYFTQLETKLETVGFNLWDEEWRNGYYNLLGEFVSNSTVIASKNPIPVIPEATYFHYSAEGYRGRHCFYDYSMNFISYIDGVNLFTVPKNAAYMHFDMLPSYGTTYNHDISINLSDQAKNGTYEPYKKNVLPLNVSNLRVKSPNIWDEEWAYGTYNERTGEAMIENGMRSVNYIPIVGGNTYYAIKPFGNWMFMVWFDSDYSVISYSDIANKTATAPQNACYGKFYIIDPNFTTASTYQRNVCINVSNPGHNGHYYPYGTFNPFPDGLRSAGNVYDEIVGNKVIRRIGAVDLGTLTWRKYLSYHGFNSVDITDMYSLLSDYNTIKYVCSKYKSYNPTGISGGPDKTIFRDGQNKQFNIVDASYDDADTTTFKDAMSGVIAYYELANYEEFELITPLCYTIKSGTTERRLPIDTPSTPNVPLCCDLTYTADASSVWEDMNSKIGNIELLLSQI